MRTTSLSSIKLLHGVGINDADVRVQNSVRIGGSKVQLWECPFYRKWSRMIERCYSESSLSKCKSYMGCTVCDEWLTFSNFKRWMENQDWEGKELDKDLLVKGNRVYSPDTCCFITRSANMFVRNAELKPCVEGSKFKARVSNPFTKKREYLGLFETHSEAVEAWRERKHQLAGRLAKLQTCPKASAALEKRYERQSNSQRLFQILQEFSLMQDLDLINDLLSEASYSFDDLDIPDVDIEYQEDDGNSNCESGSCSI